MCGFHSKWIVFILFVCFGNFVCAYVCVCVKLWQWVVFYSFLSHIPTNSNPNTRTVQNHKNQQHSFCAIAIVSGIVVLLLFRYWTRFFHEWMGKKERKRRTNWNNVTIAIVGYWMYEIIKRVIDTFVGDIASYQMCQIFRLFRCLVPFFWFIVDFYKFRFVSVFFKTSSFPVFPF